MSHRHIPRRQPPTGQVVAGVAVALGLAAAVGLLLAGDGPDWHALALSGANACSIWPLPSAAL